jgi:hypothetical protein
MDFTFRDTTELSLKKKVAQSSKIPGVFFISLENNLILRQISFPVSIVVA